MMPEYVTVALRDMGAPGAFIFLLISAVSGLTAAVVVQWRQANKVYGYRLQERDTLNKALTDSTTAMQAMTKATEEKSKVTDALADAVDKQASAFERISDRIEMQHTVMVAEVTRHGVTITSAAAVYAKTVEDIRQYLISTTRRPR